MDARIPVRRSLLALALALACSAEAVTGRRPASLRTRSRATVSRATARNAAGPVQTRYRRSPYVGAISIDAATGRTLLCDNEDRPCYPASCTKLMTLYVTLENLRQRTVALADRVYTTPESCREKPSVTGLRPGDGLTLDDLLKALMVKSANDGAVMIAQHVAAANENGAPGRAKDGGPALVRHFVDMMNGAAARLGMKNTRFVTPNGYPPPPGSTRGFDRSTAADLAILARALLRNYPEALKYTSLAGCTVRSIKGDSLAYTNHNNLLAKPKIRLPEVDGLKTGYHDSGGSSIVLTGQRTGQRAIVVVVGSSSAAERDETAGRMLQDSLNAIRW